MDHLQTDHAASRRLTSTYAEQLRNVLQVADERQLEICALREALEVCEAQKKRALYQLTQEQLEADDLRAALSSQRAMVRWRLLEGQADEGLFEASISLYSRLLFP